MAGYTITEVSRQLFTGYSADGSHGRAKHTQDRADGWSVDIFTSPGAQHPSMRTGGMTKEQAHRTLAEALFA